mmetsp:Transcript_106488/g.211556  ORF Transcript_106488/g.211556 Transcript_106488/m.211556 type:complete len:957 (+) Transcript_106488:46-2916(+)
MSVSAAARWPTGVAPVTPERRKTCSISSTDTSFSEVLIDARQRLKRPEPATQWREEAELRGGGFGQWRQLREQADLAAALAPEVDGLRKQVNERMESVQNQLGEELTARSRLEQDVAELRGNLAAVESGLAARFRDLAQGNLSTELEKLRAEVQQEASIREKETLELREEVGGEVEARERHRQQVQELMARHLAEERAEVDSRQSALARSFEELQASLVETRSLLNGPTGSSVSQAASDTQAFRNQLHDETSTRLVEFHGEIREFCGTLAERVDDLEKLAQANDCTESQSETNLSFDERLTELKKLLQDSVQNLTKELDGMQGRITDETESRDVSHMSFKRRLDGFDKILKDTLPETTKKELELALEGLRADLATSLAEMHNSINELRDSQRQPQADGYVHQVSEIESQSRVEAGLANGKKVDVDRLRADIEAVGKQVQGEREEREAHNAYLRDRIRQLSGCLIEFKAHAFNVETPAVAAAQPKDDSTGSAARPLGEQSQLLPGRAAEDPMVEGQLNANMDSTGGQACFCDAVWKHLTSERSARLHHEQKMKDRLAHEGQARELLASSLVEVRSTHAAGQRELLELVRHHKADPTRKLGAGENTTLQTLEDQLMQERADRSRQHATVIARVDSLQRSVSIFDAIIRKEFGERSDDIRQARSTFEDAVEHRQDVLPKVSLLDCLQSQAKPLTKGASLPCKGNSLQPSGPRPPTTGSARVNVSHAASPQRALSPPARAEPVSLHCRGSSAQVPTVAPPTGSQNPMPPRAVVRSASSTSCGPQAASITGRMSAPTVASTRGAAMVHNASFPMLPSPAVFCSSPGRCGPRQAVPCANGLCPSAHAPTQVSRKASLNASPNVRGRSLSASPPDRTMSPAQGCQLRPGATEEPHGFAGGSCSVPFAGGSCSVPQDAKPCFLVSNEASISCAFDEEAMLRRGLPTSACRGSLGIPFALVTAES